MSFPQMLKECSICNWGITCIIPLVIPFRIRRDFVGEILFHFPYLLSVSQEIEVSMLASLFLAYSDVIWELVPLGSSINSAQSSLVNECLSLLVIESGSWLGHSCVNPICCLVYIPVVILIGVGVGIDAHRLWELGEGLRDKEAQNVLF